ncbi:MAG TPA: hypothetical protein VFM46_04580 [Pseudomonadales bacterium]|nr:hypothetical protein [Pseudomonadales bacterium]
MLESNPIIQWITEGLAVPTPEVIKQFLEIHYADGQHMLANDELTACMSWSSPKDYQAKRQALLDFSSQLKKKYENNKLASKKFKGLQSLQAFQANTRGYHLNLLLVRPEKRGKGLSTLLLTSLIEKSIRIKLPISIELTDPVQLEIFRHADFHVADSYDLPEGPTVWRLYRSAR